MKYGIIGAMDLETKLLIEAMDAVNESTIAGMTFYKGTLGSNEAIVVTSGIGKVNAAMCAQILITKFEIDALINTGISGAIDERLEIGDIVVSTDCIEHDFDVTAFGYAPGVIPRMESSIFIADDTLIKRAYDAGVAEMKDKKIYKGRIVSGDQFVSSHDKKVFLETEFKAMTTEMEGAAIAHAATLNKVPFVIIRSMSDKADGSASDNYDAFADGVAHHSAHMVMKMLR